MKIKKIITIKLHINGFLTCMTNVKINNEKTTIKKANGNSVQKYFIVIHDLKIFS